MKNIGAAKREKSSKIVQFRKTLVSLTVFAIDFVTNMFIIVSE